MISTEDDDRFWSKVDIRGPDECWPWKGTRVKNGYGRFGANNRYMIASRVSWSLAHGRIEPPGFCCHHCDNPPCVNPAHLFLGTAKDNTQDCVRKGRIHRWNGERLGDANPRARLSAEQIGKIRSLRGTLTQHELGRAFGVHHTTISQIQTRKTWPDVP